MVEQRSKVGFTFRRNLRSEKSEVKLNEFWIMEFWRGMRRIIKDSLSSLLLLSASAFE